MNAILGWIRQRQLQVPTAILLESHRPLSFMLGQMLMAVEPLLPGIKSGRLGRTVAAWDATNPEIMDNAIAENAYADKEKRIGSESMRRIEQLLMLEVLDRRWVRHLTDLDVLREGIGLQAVAQQNPLDAYKRAAYDMFAELLESIEEDIVTRIYHVEIVKHPRQQPLRALHASAGGGGGKPAPQRKAGPRLGRNDPCWCGSGKKYKNCHMKQDISGGGNGQAARPTQAAAQTTAGAGGRRSKRRKSKKRRR